CVCADEHKYSAEQRTTFGRFVGMPRIHERNVPSSIALAGVIGGAARPRPERGQLHPDRGAGQARLGLAATDTAPRTQSPIRSSRAGLAADSAWPNPCSIHSSLGSRAAAYSCFAW